MQDALVESEFPLAKTIMGCFPRTVRWVAMTEDQKILKVGAVDRVVQIPLAKWGLMEAPGGVLNLIVFLDEVLRGEGPRVH